MSLKKEQILKAFQALDSKLTQPLTVLVGGGSAMLLAHKILISTHDVDGLALDSTLSPAKLARLTKDVAAKLNINGQWFNDYFGAFTYSLPKDFRSRLIEVFKGDHLTVKALGVSDLLLMKCFAGREKDIGHARALIRRGANTAFVEKHLEGLAGREIPGTKEALEFLEDILMEMEDASRTTK